ncbi:MAG TPA: hypothetical protein VF495_24125 [Phenylobacterium sp.]|jgi:hypothetical protein
MELRIRVTSLGGHAEAELAEELRLELDQAVGAARRIEGPRAPGAKGGGLAEAAQIAVALLSIPAIPKLVDLVGVYLQRDRRTEFEFEGPNGRVKISAVAGVVGRDEIRAAILQAIGPAEGAAHAGP